MRIIDISKALEGNKGKQALITLNDGTKISPICYGTSANGYGDLFLVVSDEKSKIEIPITTIEDIFFPES